jgi:glycosyltransferase involved in cell wall biosynthesis
MNRATAEPLRVLHTPAAVGGQAHGLAAAERELGLRSEAVTLEPSQFGHGGSRSMTRGRREYLRWKTLVRALTEFDVVHFNFGSSLLPALYGRALEFRDLALLKRRGKAVFVTYQGDDARQGDVLRRLFEFSPATEVGYYTDETDERKRAAIRSFDRYADGIFALNPDLLHVLPGRAEFLPYASVDPREWPYAEHPANDVPVVLHSPTDRAAKGTRFLVEAVDRLAAEGVRLELQIVEGLPFAEAHALYPRADLFVDQLLAGWYGGAAVELMALGRPVITYLRDSDLDFLPPGMRDSNPVLSASPETIYDVLREWLTTRKHELPEQGRRGREYVERWHDPRVVAELTAQRYAQALDRV